MPAVRADEARPRSICRSRLLAGVVLSAMMSAYGLGFGWLSAERHVTLRTNAEDLGFTEQVIRNFLRGQAFRFSLYEKAEYETDVDLAALRRPDSFLAFHVEPILVVFAPLYLVSSDVRLLLWLQAILVALGAIPAYRFARRRLGSEWSGLAFAAAYLLAPLGQWALASDFHSVALAAPLLMLAIDALDAGRMWTFLLAGLLATSTKEEIGLVFAGLGLLAAGWGWGPLHHVSGPAARRVGLAAVVLGTGWSLLCVGLIIPAYAGGAISPFTARYVHLGGSPSAALVTLFQQPGVYVEALSRPEVLSYLSTLLLAGGWLGLLAPEFLMPAAVVLALNVLSNSPWMASGRAHYSASVLPFLIAAAVVGAARLSRLVDVRGDMSRRSKGFVMLSDAKDRLQTRRFFASLSMTTKHTTAAGRPILSALLVLGAAIGYQRAGYGPFADGFVVPQRLPRHALAAQLAAAIPRNAPVSASTTLFPHLSQRASVYLFPTLRDADYVFVDVAGNAFPISPGGIYRRVQELLGGGEFRVLAAEDGLLLLEREAAATRPLPERFFDFARATRAPPNGTQAGFLDGSLELVRAELVPTGDVGPRGPLAVLETSWSVQGELAGRPRPSLHVSMHDGSRQHFYDLPPVWWYPPETWRPGELVHLEVAGLPLREVADWWAEVATGEAVPSARLPSSGETGVTAGLPAEPAAEPAGANVEGREAMPEREAATRVGSPPSGAPPPLLAEAAATPAGAFQVQLGELSARVERDPWRLALLDPRGRPFWEAAPQADGDGFAPLGYRDAAGDTWHLTRLLEAATIPDGAVLVAATDEPNGRTATLELRSLGPRTVRLAFTLSDPSWIAAVGGVAVTEADERFLGFGERFDGVDQRGRIVHTWAQDRRDVDFGPSTYAPIPFYISSRGYSLLLQSDARGHFDVAKRRPDRVAWEVEQPTASLVLSYGPAPRDLVQWNAGLTGLPPLPPVWAFGVWKTAIGGSQEVLQDAARLREQRLPVSGLLVYDATDEQALLGWPHIGFAGRRRGRYPDVRALTDRLHGQGFKVLGYKNADFSARLPEQAALARSGLAIGDPSGGGYIHPHHLVSWVDFTSSEAVAWWGTLWRRILVDLGFDGAMLDLGEVAPEDARYADGTTGIETHNRSLTLYARATFEAARAVRGDDFAIFARSASLGAQRYQSLQWSGDQTITWDQEGIRGLVPAALSIGLSGFPYWHPEIGGYLSVGLPRSSERELWFRWLQLGALSPLLRDNYGEHVGEPVEAWSGRETVDAFREYARLHNSLVPYLYSLARVATETGLPIIRHLVLSAPDDPRAWAEEYAYTLGDDLFVAPVLEEGARLRTVYLPPGSWVDWWTGELWQGGRVVTVDAPLDRIPIFARLGAILPLAPDFDTLAPSDDSNVLGWDGSLVLRVVAPARSGRARERLPTAEQRLFDGTLLRTSVEGGALTLSADAPGSAGPPAERRYDLRLPAAAPPSRVLRDGFPLDGWTYADGTVSMSLRAASFSVTVEP